MKNAQDDRDEYKIRFEFEFHSWFEIISWVVWGIFEIFFIQGALASYKEFEPRAGIVFAAFAVVLLFYAFFVLLIRRNKLL